jgi:5'-nucleotidase
MLKILLTNEAGCFTPGIISLAKELNKMHRVVIAAPLNPLKGSGHTITVDEHPLHAKQWYVLNGVKIFSVDGTPCDCVTLALDKLLKSPPDLIISGIDNDNNRGNMIYTSGIVSSAIEGAIQGVKSIAVSAKVKDADKEGSFVPIAKYIHKNLKQLMGAIPKGGLLNINFPTNFSAGRTMVTHLTGGLIDNKYDIEANPFGATFAWLKSPLTGFGLDAIEQKGDLYWLKKDYITITPMHLDLMNVDAITTIQNAGISV